MTLTGRVVFGAGQGAAFTQLDWAREQFIRSLGIDPYPGTLNLVLENPDDLAAWSKLKSTPGVSIVSPNPQWCNARCYRVRAADQVNGAIVLPQVQNYPGAQLEIIADISLREALALQDGDLLTLYLDVPSDPEDALPMTTRNKGLAYLRQHNVMSIATNGVEGLWSAAVFYVNDGFTLYFLSAPSSRHSLNIAQHTPVAATIQEDYHEWRAIQGIQLEGDAARIEGAEQARAIWLYGEKFPLIAQLAHAPAEIAQAFARIVWYRVVPTRLYFIDNSLGLGHREEIQL